MSTWKNAVNKGEKIKQKLAKLQKLTKAEKEANNNCEAMETCLYYIKNEIEFLLNKSGVMPDHLVVHSSAAKVHHLNKAKSHKKTFQMYVSFIYFQIMYYIKTNLSPYLIKAKSSILDVRSSAAKFIW